MIKNPLKYQRGGTAASQEQLVKLFQAAAKNAQVDPEQLVQKASEIGQDEEAVSQFMQGLQLCAQGDPEGIKFIKSLFQSPAFRKGGKIFEFICKHAKGGYVSGCGCGGNVKKGQNGLPFVDERPQQRPNRDRNNYFLGYNGQVEPMIYGKADPMYAPAGSPTELEWQPVFHPVSGQLVGYRYFGNPEENWDSPNFYRTMQTIYNDRGDKTGIRYSNGRNDQGKKLKDTEQYFLYEKGGKVVKAQGGLEETPYPTVYNYPVLPKDAPEHKNGREYTLSGLNRGGGGYTSDYGDVVEDENGLSYRDVRDTDWNSAFGRLSQSYHREYVPNRAYKRAIKRGFKPIYDEYTPQQTDSLKTVFDEKFGNFGTANEDGTWGTFSGRINDFGVPIQELDYDEKIKNKLGF